MGCCLDINCDLLLKPDSKRELNFKCLKQENKKNANVRHLEVGAKKILSGSTLKGQINPNFDNSALAV